MIKKLIAIGILIYFSLINLAYAIDSHAVVLMYHRFGEDRYPSTNISTESFIQQLDFIEENGFKVWPLEKVVEYLRAKQPLPDKVVSITIDDAYLSVYQIAYPILQQRKMPFTIFVSTDYLDKGYSSYMSWDELKDMVQHGVAVGNHSTSHDHLIERHNDENYEAWLTRVAEEIFNAEYRIEQNTGYRTTLYAHPYGEYNNVLAKYIGDLGYISFGQQSGPIGENSNFNALPRFPISDNYADMSAFKQKLYSLPMPIESISPKEVVTLLSMPSVRVSLSQDLKESKYSLLCFASGQGAIHATWLNNTQFVVKAHKPFSLRRSRYNCTIRDHKSNRFYWYSHLWIKPQLPEAINEVELFKLRQFARMKELERYR